MDSDARIGTPHGYFQSRPGALPPQDLSRVLAADDPISKLAAAIEKLADAIREGNRD